MCTHISGRYSLSAHSTIAASFFQLSLTNLHFVINLTDMFDQFLILLRLRYWRGRGVYCFIKQFSALKLRSVASIVAFVFSSEARIAKYRLQLRTSLMLHHQAVRILVLLICIVCHCRLITPSNSWRSAPLHFLQTHFLCQRLPSVLRFSSLALASRVPENGHLQLAQTVCVVWLTDRQIQRTLYLCHRNVSQRRFFCRGFTTHIHTQTHGHVCTQ